jgi:hypothetical protein
MCAGDRVFKKLEGWWGLGPRPMMATWRQLQPYVGVGSEVWSPEPETCVMLTYGGPVGVDKNGGVAVDKFVGNGDWPPTLIGM